MKNKVAIIIPYFGKLPNTFTVWLKSANANSKFDFLIFTDDKDYYKFDNKPNVKFIYITFLEFKAKIQNYVDFDICLDKPYKLCDYRPIYGLALQEFLNGYDFWGFGDIDLVYGNLEHFINDHILNEYDKVYDLGHLTLLRNIPECNELWKFKHNLTAYRYDEGWRTPYSCHFDEGWGLTKIAESKGIKTYIGNDFFDIYPFKKGFYSYNKSKQDRALEKDKDFYFVWEKGNLYLKDNVNKDSFSRELAYVHFQKRKIQVKNSSVNEKFFIVPNQIVDNLNDTDCNYNTGDMYKELNVKKVKQHLSRIKNHSIQQKFFRIIRPIYRKFNR